MNPTAKEIIKISEKLPGTIYTSEEGCMNNTEYQSIVTIPKKECKVGFSEINNLTIVLPNDKHIKARVKKLLELIASEDF